jgi:3-phenylpropionate/trans-cinnamate dioxygenase ferredoxin reductase subunit
LVEAMSDDRRILIVGGGPAAHAAAGAYREAGGEGPVTILAAEHQLPYERPPLTKGYLRGESGPEDLPIEPAGWYFDRDIELRRGVEVAALDLDAGRAATVSGETHSFDRVLLATGARPKVPPVPGADGPGVRYIRTVIDSELLAEQAGASVVVVGSGFIGCEAAASLAMLGTEVTMATLEASPQAARLGEEVSARIRGWLEDYGVTFLPEAKLAEVVTTESVLARFEDGREASAAAVLLALGVDRNDGLAVAAGVEVDEGVLVDAAMVSTDERLLAAGDVAYARNATAERRLRVEHWGEALNMGAIAGATLAGASAEWKVAPGFWSEIGGHTLKCAGWGDGFDEVRFEAGDDGAFAAWYGRGGELVGVVAHEDDEAYEKGKERIEERAPWE